MPQNPASTSQAGKYESATAQSAFEAHPQLQAAYCDAQVPPAPSTAARQPWQALLVNEAEVASHTPPPVAGHAALEQVDQAA